MTCRVEKLVPMSNVTLIESLERGTAGDYQVEWDFRHPPRVRLFTLSHRLTRIIIRRAARRPAFF